MGTFETEERNDIMIKNKWDKRIGEKYGKLTIVSYVQEGD